MYDSELALHSATKPTCLKLHNTVALVDASTLGHVAVLAEGNRGCA